MKRILAYALCIALMLGCLPGVSMAKSKQMEDGVPVWTEETVRQYALDYIAGTEMSRLWNYYDLQIRRYMPQQAFENFLIDLEFLTGDFQKLGSYRCFEEPENKQKTHVLHLCMERVDVDMYFTHKNQEDDWEVMALEFVPSAEEDLPEGFVGALEDVYTETEVTVGTDQYPLKGILTMPNNASAQNCVPACVFVHDFGAHDRDLTLGKTAMFKDFAAELAEMGIASIRYDKRSFTYPDARLLTLGDEVVQDALSAVEMLKADPRVDSKRMIVIGLGLGAMTAPRIASQSNGDVTGMIMIGGVADSLINVEYSRAGSYLNTLSEEQRNNEQYIVRNFKSMTEGKALEQEVLGRGAYYYWEAEQYPQVRTIINLALPVFIAQGKRDPVVDENQGRRAYYEAIGNSSYIEYESFRGLNHLLMNDLTVGSNGEPQYQIETHMDKYAARTLANWILSLYQ